MRIQREHLRKYWSCTYQVRHVPNAASAHCKKLLASTTKSPSFQLPPSTAAPDPGNKEHNRGICDGVATTRSSLRYLHTQNNTQAIVDPSTIKVEQRDGGAQLAPPKLSALERSHAHTAGEIILHHVAQRCRCSQGTVDHSSTARAFQSDPNSNTNTGKALNRVFSTGDTAIHQPRIPLRQIQRWSLQFGNANTNSHTSLPQHNLPAQR
jgi:hypothetical protein